jgi:hypothetical protein
VKNPTIKTTTKAMVSSSLLEAAGERVLLRDHLYPSKLLQFSKTVFIN